MGERLRFRVSAETMLWVVFLSVALRIGLLAAARTIVEPKGKDAALELTTESFNNSLWSAPANNAIVEFYAHWCPACQKFKPQYERVAELFNGPATLYPGVLLMAKVDCAEDINRDICQRFAVLTFPTLLWGKPSNFAWGSRDEAKDEDFEKIPMSTMSAQTLLDWINIKLDASYSLRPAAQKPKSGKGSESVPVQDKVASIQDIEEATVESYDIMLDMMNAVMARGPFTEFLRLVAAYHPSSRCKAGTEKILAEELDDSKSEQTLDLVALRKLPICGAYARRKRYQTCSRAENGYSCGLWYLFHSLSVRVDENQSNGAMRAISDFVAFFFACEECRQHFLQMSRLAVDTVASRRDLVLWLWRTHNVVNRRVAGAAAVSPDLKRSKFQWPSKTLCPACRISLKSSQSAVDEDVDWDEEEVYKFLRKTYGESIFTVSEEVLTLGNDRDGEASSSLTPSVGAAVGIGIACFGFGLLACCWRSPRKKLKRIYGTQD